MHMGLFDTSDECHLILIMINYFALEHDTIACPTIPTLK